MGSFDLDKKYHNSLKTYDYNYHTFFPIGDPEDDKIKLKFRVKAHRDAHILLSPCMHPEEGLAAYEIVLGAGDNTYSAIRRSQQGDNEVIAEDVGVSHDEWTEFWIKIKKGKIKVGTKDDKAFMKWQDPNPFPVNYYSFSSYDGTAALWKFPCFHDKNFWL